jgi:hypothetical protein
MCWCVDVLILRWWLCWCVDTLMLMTCWWLCNVLMCVCWCVCWCIDGDKKCHSDKGSPVTETEQLSALYRSRIPSSLCLSTTLRPCGFDSTNTPRSLSPEGRAGSICCCDDHVDMLMCWWLCWFDEVMCWWWNCVRYELMTVLMCIVLMCFWKNVQHAHVFRARVYIPRLQLAVEWALPGRFPERKQDLSVRSCKYGHLNHKTINTSTHQHSHQHISTSTH